MMKLLGRYIPYLLIFTLALVAMAEVLLLPHSFSEGLIKTFLPTREYIGECLQNGQIPWWDPQLDMGYPIHANPASGAWSPIVWLIGLTAGYSKHLFEIECGFHFLIGGIGMLALARTLKLNWALSMVTAILFMVFVPFYSDLDLQHHTFSLCWLPLLLNYTVRLGRDMHHTDAIKASISLFLLFTSGSILMSIMGLGFLILVYLFRSIQLLISGNRKGLWKLSFRNAQLLSYSVLFSLGAVISLYQLKPYLSADEQLLSDDTELRFSVHTTLARDYPLLLSMVRDTPLMMLSDTLLSTDDLDIHQAEGSFENDQLYFDSFDLEYLKQRTFEHLHNDTLLTRSNTANELHIKTSTARKCLLTLKQTYYKGWKASVNGRKARIFKSNLAFMTIVVPPGENEVKFEYSNPMVKTAFLVSIFFLLTAFITLIYSEWKKRRKVTA